MTLSRERDALIDDWINDNEGGLWEIFTCVRDSCAPPTWRMDHVITRDVFIIARACDVMQDLVNHKIKAEMRLVTTD